MTQTESIRVMNKALQIASCHESINISFNFIEILRPICNLDGMQFAELYS